MRGGGNEGVGNEGVALLRKLPHRTTFESSNWFHPKSPLFSEFAIPSMRCAFGESWYLFSLDICFDKYSHEIHTGASRRGNWPFLSLKCKSVNLSILLIPSSAK